MGENKNLDAEQPSSTDNDCMCGGCSSSRVSLSNASKYYAKVGSVLSTFKYPLLMACACIELAIFLPYFITLIAQSKALGITGLIASQSPIIYYMLKNFLRRQNLIIDERGETRDTTKIAEKVDAYIGLCEKEWE